MYTIFAPAAYFIIIFKKAVLLDYKFVIYTFMTDNMTLQTVVCYKTFVIYAYSIYIETIYHVETLYN
jgi:hypothetical protein